MVKMVKIKCNYCGKKVERNASEVKRNKQLLRKNYCSLSCSAKSNTGKNYDSSYSQNGHPISKCDEFTPFRIHLHRIRAHAKEHQKEMNLTLEDIKEQWDKQKGICPYTGWKLITPSSQAEKLAKTPDRASLDRIDNSKGYIKENIQFVSMMAQYAKNAWSEHELFKFCESVIRNKNGQ